MPISHYREQRIMLLAKMNLGLASNDQEEINLYNDYQKTLGSGDSVLLRKVKKIL